MVEKYRYRDRERSTKVVVAQLSKIKLIFEQLFEFTKNLQYSEHYFSFLKFL